jgi:hypothetical protein
MIESIVPQIETERKAGHSIEFECYLSLECKRENSSILENTTLPTHLLSPPLDTIFIKEDRGPYTKLYPALERYSNKDTIIITLDDDRIYPPETISTLISATKEFPLCTVGLRGRSLPISLDYNKSTKLEGPHHEIANVDILTGAGGIAYKRSHFSSIEEELSLWSKAIQICPQLYYIDDIWNNGRLASRNVLRICIPGPDSESGHIRMHAAAPLSETVNRDNTNNNAGIQYFKEVW